MRVEVDARGVLVEPGGEHVVGFLDRHAVDGWSILSPTA